MPVCTCVLRWQAFKVSDLLCIMLAALFTKMHLHVFLFLLTKMRLGIPSHLFFFLILLVCVVCCLDNSVSMYFFHT